MRRTSHITILTLGIAIVGVAATALFFASPPAASPEAALKLPERPATFEELMALADKNKATNSIIESYFNTVPAGEGTDKVIALADQGNPKAMTLGCFILENGMGGVRDIAKSNAYCEAAAAAGETAAMANLLYRNFNSNPKNGNWQQTHNAFSAMMETAPARAHKGLRFLYGQYHPKGSYRQMEYHAEEAIKLDNTSSMYALAMIDLRGPVQFQNFERAERNLKRAYGLYDFDAGLALAREYRNGDKLEKDEATYAAMVKRMVKFRHRDSITELAYMYDTGKGVEQSGSRAMDLHIEAAELGSLSSKEAAGYKLLKAANNIQQQEKGVAYLEDCATQGKIEPMKALSEHYARKDIADPNDNKTKWLAMAALSGDERSQELLSFSYMETGYIKQMTPYIEGLDQAHKAGYIDASFHLARHYRAASGVKRDIRKALKILKTVDNSNDPRIKEELEIVQSYIEFFGGIDAVPEIIKR